MAGFLEQLAGVELRYEEMTHLLSQPDVAGNNQRYTALMKEYTELTPLVECWRAYRKAEAAHREAKELLAQGGLEKDFREMVEEELEGSRAAMEEGERQLKLLLLPKDPNDQKNVILEIRAGAGGEEAALFAGSLYRMYTMYIEKKGFTYKILDYLDGDEAGIKSASILVEGLNAYGYLKAETGVHRLVRVSPFDASGRRQTSFASLEVMPEITADMSVEIREEDIKMDVYRSSGAGGQKVNKTSSAVRLTHLPTGIVVACQVERSQFQNREVAMNMLRSKLIEIKEREHLDKIEDIKGDQKDIAWGSQIRSYVFMPYTMVKDHRTGFETSNVQAVMDGDLDGFVNEYLKQKSSGKI